MKSTVFLITCEHAGNQVPHIYQAYFEGAEEVLFSHQGWDPGALSLAQEISAILKAELVTYEYTRLLIEVNRSLHHEQLFSTYTRSLSEEVKTYLINTYYKPYRDGVEDKIRKLIAAGSRVVHLSIHSFTQNYFGEHREVEVGLLFDPERLPEYQFCRAWLDLLSGESSAVVRFNEPYLGVDDGFTTHLRRQFSEDYVGVELEVSQQRIDQGQLRMNICQTLLALSAHSAWSVADQGSLH